MLNPTIKTFIENYNVITRDQSFLEYNKEKDKFERTGFFGRLIKHIVGISESDTNFMLAINIIKFIKFNEKFLNDDQRKVLIQKFSKLKNSFSPFKQQKLAAIISNNEANFIKKYQLDDLIIPVSNLKSFYEDYKKLITNQTKTGYSKSVKLRKKIVDFIVMNERFLNEQQREKTYIKFFDLQQNHPLCNDSIVNDYMISKGLIYGPKDDREARSQNETLKRKTKENIHHTNFPSRAKEFEDQQKNNKIHSEGQNFEIKSEYENSKVNTGKGDFDLKTIITLPFENNGPISGDFDLKTIATQPFKTNGPSGDFDVGSIFKGIF